MHILIVSSKCDAVGRFMLVCIRFDEKKRVFLAIDRAAREITPTRRLICRADFCVRSGALTNDFRAHTNC